MKRLFCYSFYILFVCQAYAQSNHLVHEYGNLYRQYEFPQIKDTPAPHGFKPFYISHLGRHGSRYPVSRAYVYNGLDILQKGDSLGILTKEGHDLLQTYQKFDSLCVGMYGMLSDKGIKEHKLLAERMSKRFFSVFSNARRSRINVSSTDIPRAIVSGANFCSTLASHTSDLDFRFITGPKYTQLICNDSHPRIIANNKVGASLSDAYMEKHFPYASFYGRIFTDTQKIYAQLKTKRLLVESTFANGIVADALGFPDMLRQMTPEEFKEASMAYTNKMFYNHCNGKVPGQWRRHFMDELLKDVISKADAALSAGSNVAADLRFGHDTGIMPFFSLIGIEAFERQWDFDEACLFWNPTETMCMATNFQMIFYQNKQQDVLVKMLVNEKETCLPLLKPFAAPYYKWDDLKAYFLRRLAD